MWILENVTIARKTKHKISVNAKLESLEERLKMIRNHDSDLAVRRDFNQKLLTEHSVQLETEDHLYRLSGNTESLLRQETHEFEKEWLDVNRRVSSVEKELIRMFVLSEQIARKTKHKISVNAKLESLEERLKMIRNHDSDLAVRRDFNQKLLTEHSVQLETEDHLYRLSGNTESLLRQETHEFEKEWLDVNRRVSSVEKELIRVMRKLTEAKEMVQFDENSLHKWEEMLARKNEDSQLIEDYMKQDTQKYKELEQKRQKLSMELEIYRQTIIKTVGEVREMEIVLNRTAKLYMEALKERKQMINQWMQSVNILRQRDNDIQNGLREIETLREISREKKKNLEEVEQFLKDQIVNNKEIEQLIKYSEKKLNAVQEKQRKIVKTIDIYVIELHTQKKLMADLARRVQQIRANAKRKKIGIENKQIKVDDCKKQINHLMLTLEEVENQKLNVEEKTKHLEKMIEHDEKRKYVIIKESSQLQAMILRTTKRIMELENERKILQIEMQSEYKKVDLLNALLVKENKLIGEKKEALYQVSFSLQKCEMKLEQIKGHERDKSEIEKKQTRIEELQAVLKEKTATYKLLQNQIVSLEHDMKKISTGLLNENDELERLRSKKQDLLLLLDGGEKRLKIAQSRNEEKQVEENIIRLQVLQLERMTSNVSDKVYDLEKYRLHLEATLKERAAEITAQKEAFAIQKRIADNECSELRTAITDRKSRIRQLQMRYDNSVATIGTTVDGAPMNTAYLKIQSAQERYMLREQGDKLDETIRRTEQEIRSMENTLRVVNVCNDKYRDSMSTVDQDGPEWTEQNRLDEQMHNARQKLLQKQTQLQRLFDKLQKTQNDYTQLFNDIEKSKEEKENKERYLSGIEKQMADQEEKISRANKSLRKVQKDINLYVSKRDDAVLLQQREVELRELQEQNALVLQDIAEFTIRHVEAEAYVKKLLITKNIELPYFPSSIKSPSSTGTIDHLKSTSRISAFTSSRESISSVIKIEPQFEEPSNASRKTAKHPTSEESLALSKRSTIAHKKQQLWKKL
ncbi:PREDICTED: coiled-coil domain-containing protein 39-like [Acromyrmex echinatior]|uniref:coiled-coil domain-containing protein 39-like n=1 Tax=Acromyrmex echinatior TaxID=103372 RepID=UPI000580C78C|nr:PREDICTED: coiled-coil domain-containing protein 39-like [Acromyrmex echinatior]